jgi:hypothetical protein
VISGGGERRSSFGQQVDLFAVRSFVGGYHRLAGSMGDDTHRTGPATTTSTVGRTPTTATAKQD